MNITILDNGSEIRRAFIKKFTMPWNEFQERYKEWIQSMAESNYTVRYEKLYLWELMDYPAISFAQSLELLRSMQGDVFLMSENDSKPHCHGIVINRKEYKGGVAITDAAELADLIEREWNEGGRHCILPEDLYVFDAAMKRLLAFTHEYDGKGRRYCKMVGFMCT